ncbi:MULTISPECIES: type VI secretion system tube protein TssD [unclassified Pseudomonas]|uniref:type VI secretion system tube protein TssD n=1 Tax=unclassified Pseudomonas TaxID=196821 RepID=UPI00224B0584|nr:MULTISPECIES: type VI secretion system tube protein TssD [unclassified Pseudomonas]MCX2890160.1 type VI secretion system tube protein TssD [Pseudomonas sp. DCB_BI]MDH4552140.1 type VI secretion system tube protein Hcp [Pseudomonas sp. BN607]
MASPAYLKITGTAGGNISEGASTVESIGNIYQSDFENEIMLQKIEHEINTPIDPQNGQPSGKRVHGPYKVTFTTNKSKPILLESICKAELLPEVTIKQFRATNENPNQHYYTTTLTDATIIKLRTHQPHAQEDTLTPRHQEVELWFSYRKITETHVKSSTEGSDDWQKA